MQYYSRAKYLFHVLLLRINWFKIIYQPQFSPRNYKYGLDSSWRQVYAKNWNGNVYFYFCLSILMAGTKMIFKKGIKEVINLTDLVRTSPIYSLCWATLATAAFALTMHFCLSFSAVWFCQLYSVGWKLLVCFQRDPLACTEHQQGKLCWTRSCW